MSYVIFQKTVYSGGDPQRGIAQEVMEDIEAFRDKGEMYCQSTKRKINSVASVHNKSYERAPLDTFIVGLKATRVFTQDGFAITHLSFCFRVLRPCGPLRSFVQPDCEEARCEIDSMDFLIEA